jgi:hypothetical protein
MSLILALIRKWVGWYRVLRYGKAFSFVDSIRYGLWLARVTEIFDYKFWSLNQFYGYQDLRQQSEG